MSPKETITLRPGCLVSLHTKLEGGVHYTRVDLEADKRPVDAIATVEKWETTKVVEDPAEYDRAVKVRGKCGSLIRAACAPSAFGLLCPVSREAELDAAIVEARALADNFNATAQGVRVSVYALKGRIAESDTEAARAISSELRDLLGSMQAGIAACDVEAIRAAANKAKQVGGMLDATAQAKVQAAIGDARSAAREITRALVAGGDKASIVVEECNLRALQEARFAFLDLDVPAPAEGGGEGGPLPSCAPRALDMGEGEGEGSQESKAASAAPGRELEV